LAGEAPALQIQARLKNFQTSGVRAESESNVAVNSPAQTKINRRRSFIAIGTKTRKENHEEML
jgi:hypothetical protein